MTKPSYQANNQQASQPKWVGWLVMLAVCCVVLVVVALVNPRIFSGASRIPEKTVQTDDAPYQPLVLTDEPETKGWRIPHPVRLRIDDPRTASQEVSNAEPEKVIPLIPAKPVNDNAEKLGAPAVTATTVIPAVTPPPTASIKNTVADALSEKCTALGVALSGQWLPVKNGQRLLGSGAIVMKDAPSGHYIMLLLSPRRLETSARVRVQAHEWMVNHDTAEIISASGAERGQRTPVSWYYRGVNKLIIRPGDRQRRSSIQCNFDFPLSAPAVSQSGNDALRIEFPASADVTLSDVVVSATHPLLSNKETAPDDAKK
jgi:hypothetical protein